MRTDVLDVSRNRSASDLVDPDQEMKDSIRAIAPKGTDEFYNSIERDRAEALAIRKRCRLAKQAM